MGTWGLVIHGNFSMNATNLSDKCQGRTISQLLLTYNTLCYVSAVLCICSIFGTLLDKYCLSGDDSNVKVTSLFVRCWNFIAGFASFSVLISISVLNYQSDCKSTIVEFYNDLHPFLITQFVMMLVLVCLICGGCCTTCCFGSFIKNLEQERSNEGYKALHHWTLE